MEAAAAVGVASAAVQFLDFSVKTIALCKEVRDSTDGSTKANDDLSKSVKQMKDWQKDLQKKFSTTSGEARRLRETIGACMNIADELLQLLEHIRAMKKKPLGTLRVALRALRGEKRIEKIQSRLSDCQAKFHVALTADMRKRVLKELEAQGQNTARMQAIILQKLEFTHNGLKALDETVTRTAATTQQEISSLAADQRNSSAILRRGQQDLDGKITSQFSNLAVSSTHQEFLNRLYFEEMFLRQESMKGCSPGTYDWVFSGKLPDQADPHMHQFMRQEEHLELRGRIVRWLSATGGPSVFWINGKPGSGKSSLMSYIMSDPRTEQHLKQWAGSRNCNIFSFFFWKPGSSLQKTRLGFRRSMLWQLCKAKNSVIVTLLLHNPFFRFTPWTEQRLTEAIRRVLLAYHEEAILLMIDGLDECEDDHSDLLDEVLQVTMGPYAKVCLSSRPEEIIRRRLGMLPTISLQELNYGDIFHFAYTKLQRGGAGKDELAGHLARAAEGVFLWAVRVSDSLCSGLMAEDDDLTLLQRLHEYPKGLDDLFTSMFASIDKFHFEALQFYFFAAQQSFFSVALAVTSRPAEQLTSLKQLGRLCEREIVRIRSQSKGLLEIEHGMPDLRPRWALRDLPDGAPSKRRLEDEELRILTQYRRTSIHFVHRSAYDYIFKDVDDRLPSWARTTNIQVIAGTVFTGFVWLAQYGDFIYKRDNGRFFQLSFGLQWRQVLSESGLSKIDEEQICEGLGSILDALESWESKQASISDLDLKRATDEDATSGLLPVRELGLDSKEPNELPLFGDFWPFALTLQPRFVLLNLPRIWDRAETYINVISLLDTWIHGIMSVGSTIEEYTFHPDMDSVVFAVITNFRLQGHSTSSLSGFPHVKGQRDHSYSIKKTWSCRKIDLLLNSWYEAGLPHEADVAETLSSMTISLDRSRKRQGEEIFLTPPGYDDPLRILILGVLRATFDTWKLFQGPCITRANKMLPLQLSLPAVPASVWTSTLTDVEKECSLSAQLETGIRLSCFADHETKLLNCYEDPGPPFKAIATYQLSPKVTNVLMEFGIDGHRGIATTLFVGSPTQRSRCTDMVMAELWDDPNSQLTAWGQLYLRACVKSYFVHFWREHEHDWPLKDWDSPSDQEGGFSSGEEEVSSDEDEFYSWKESPEGDL